MTISTPNCLCCAFTSRCSACVAGLKVSRELLPLQPVPARTSTVLPVAVTTWLCWPLVPGTFTTLMEPLACCRAMNSVPQAPSDWRYRPLFSFQASIQRRGCCCSHHPGGQHTRYRRPLVSESHHRRKP